MRPQKGMLGKIRWHLNSHLVRRLWLLNAARARLTIVDAYGAPGDTLLTATIARHVRQRYPRLRLNGLTPNPQLLQHDPNFVTLNVPETFFSVWSWYPDLVSRRDGTTNVLSETLDRVGWHGRPYEYRARVFLTAAERERGREILGTPARPVVTFHTRSNEPVKDWPLDRWAIALSALRDRFHLVHLGDEREPLIEGVQRFAGRLTMRESMSVLAHAQVHLGPDSFLMHAANGLDVRAVIIFGGSRTPASVGYAQNVNLNVAMECGPCWIHSINGDQCEHDLACMDRIAPADVIAAVDLVAVGA